MQDAGRVGVGQGLEQAARHRDRLLGGERAFLQSRAERRAGDVLEGQDGGALGFEQLVEGGDTGVLEPGHRFRFQAKAPAEVVPHFLIEDLERRHSPQGEVARQEDLPHPSGTQGAEHRVRTEAAAGGKVDASPGARRAETRHRHGWAHRGRDQRWPGDEAARFLVCTKQRLDLVPQHEVARARVVHIRAPPRRLQLQGRPKHTGDLGPTLGRHLGPGRGLERSSPASCR